MELIKSYPNSQQIPFCDHAEHRIPPFLTHQIGHFSLLQDLSILLRFPGFLPHPHLSTLEIFFTTTCASGQEHITVGGLTVQCFSCNASKKRSSVLHEIEARGTLSSTSPLLFVSECRGNTPFLVDSAQLVHCHHCPL